MNSMLRKIIILIMTVVLLGCGPDVSTQKKTIADDDPLAAMKENNAAGFARAYQPRSFHFPADHGPHPQFRNEWWYVTGNLHTANQRHFGYQITFFRVGILPSDEASSSEWLTNQVYFAHFALTDTEQRQHHHFERFMRGSLDLAGSQAQPFRVWLQDWQMVSIGPETFPIKIQAAQEDISLELDLEPLKDKVLQGERGLSQKSAEPGNASFYYSYTRLATQGKFSVAGDSFTVSGSSWLDREWSTSALAPNQAGWDWFALQLDNGEELMYYQLRLKEGHPDPLSKGILVRRNNAQEKLTSEDVELTPQRYWRSAKTQKRYPVAWSLKVPKYQIDLQVTSVLDSQEMLTAVQYWEGAVAVSGRWHGQLTKGRGYLEMTGY